MRISLLTVPVEANYQEHLSVVRPGTDVFVSSARAVGVLPIMPKIAIVSLIKWMEKHGYTKDQYDFYDVDMLLPSDEELVEYFKSYNPTVVGLSAVVSTCYLQVKRISRLLRETCPDAWIVLGGSLTASANLILNKTPVDICAVGDGEVTWVDFLNYVKENGRKRDLDALGKISGLSFLDETGELRFTGYGKAIPGEDNPFPDYDILQAGLKDRPHELANYFRPGIGPTEFRCDPRSYEPHRRPMLAQMWSSKGCVARCTFCQRSTKGYRTLGVDPLDEHLQMLADRFNVGFIHILDENFGSNKEYAYELSRKMQNHGMLWMASGVRVTSLEFEDIKYFKDHGCVALKFGVESGSQKILDLMEKKFTVDRVYNTLKHLADLEMCSPLAVMVGMPGETCETATETGKFVGRLSHMQGVDPYSNKAAIFYALPLTGTPLYQYGQKIGVFGKRPDDEEAILLSVSGSSANKPNYINLNGSKIRHVIWWDWLVKLEAQRTFYDLCKKKPLGKPNLMQKIILESGDREVIGKPLTLTQILLDSINSRSMKGVKSKVYNRVFNWFEDIFMEHYVVPSRFVASLPRWLVYPILKNVLYVSFLVQGIVLRAFGRDLNLWHKWPDVPPVQAVPKRHAGEVQKIHTSIDINMSLRRVVRDSAAVRPIRTQTEANQDILSAGL
jgi:anaerobic magnesium-protoporphyrin IX monomethyl ester cyclase